MPTVSSGVVESALKRMIFNLQGNIDGSISTYESGREGVGEYLSVLANDLGKVVAIRVNAIVLGVAENATFEAAENRFSAIQTLDHRSVPVSVEVVDVPTLQNQWDRSSKSGTVDLVLSEFVGGPLPCLRTTGSGGEFDTYLAIIPGNSLADIYYRFKSKVLQKNLRNFLQATGKVNKGIQKTLKEQPERFLAYNNGLTITASAAELDEVGRILVLRDFQIVNGGQTTASLDHAKRFMGVDLSKVSVQAKITVIDTTADPKFIDDVSNYANSQNKVKLSDFSARDNFQVVLAGLMRDNPELQCVWDTGEVNYWYYESFRAGYATAKNQLLGAQRARFEKNFPQRQVIDKLELAKVENLWDGYPYFVCRGADKNFVEWVKRTRPHSRPEPDVEFCAELVAKVIMFRAYADLVREIGFGGFKSQIAAYSFSFHRFLLERRGREVDLNRIWECGHIPIELSDTMRQVVTYVGDFLTKQAGSEDPAQWSKKQVAWDRLQRLADLRHTPNIYPHLRAVDLLRPYNLDLSVACAKVMDVLQKARTPMSKIQIFKVARVPDAMWGEVRRELLSNYGVRTIGHGYAMRYSVGD